MSHKVCPGPMDPLSAPLCHPSLPTEQDRDPYGGDVGMEPKSHRLSLWTPDNRMRDFWDDRERRHHPSTQRGLTLVEVLVAMLVLGTAVASLLALLNIHTQNTLALEDNVLGRIVAENAMVTVVTQEATGRRQDDGEETTLAGREFTWFVSRTPSPYEGVEIIRVSVIRADTEREVASLQTLRRQTR